MFLKEPNTGLELLAPVQVTPFITGIFGTPEGEDGNGHKTGGGGVNTFGFNSAYVGASSIATVAQTRQWSLTDAVGRPVPGVAPEPRGSRRSRGG
jgi:hypothetical protein